MQFLGVVEHPNLVKLIGYCGVDGERGIQRLLVYEFMQNKSLEDHLFSKAYPALTWQRRLQIVLGAARGLAYLHEELEVQVCRPCLYMKAFPLCASELANLVLPQWYRLYIEISSLQTCC